MIAIFDIVNGFFEGFGAFAVWANIAKLKRDREIKGIVWQFTIMWWLWGVFNLFYYPSLGQWFSFSSGCVLVVGNAVWLLTWLKIMKENRCACSSNVKSG